VKVRSLYEDTTDCLLSRLTFFYLQRQTAFICRFSESNHPYISSHQTSDALMYSLYKRSWLTAKSVEVVLTNIVGVLVNFCAGCAERGEITGCL
jgi:hypothetical protein